MVVCLELVWGAVGVGGKGCVWGCVVGVWVGVLIGLVGVWLWVVFVWGRFSLVGFFVLVGRVYFWLVGYGRTKSGRRSGA